MKNLKKSLLVLLLLLVLVCLVKSEQIKDFQTVLSNYVKNSLNKPIQYSMQDKTKAVRIFNKYLNQIVNESQKDQNNLSQISTHKQCTQTQRVLCSLYAIDFMHRCKDVDNSESCMNEYLLAYPVCLKCYCPYIMAKTCQASDFVFWIAEQLWGYDDCDYAGIFKTQCGPWLLALFLKFGACVWCQCIQAYFKGYHSPMCVSMWKNIGQKSKQIQKLDEILLNMKQKSNKNN